MTKRAVLGSVVGVGMLLAACGLPPGDPPSLSEVADTEENDTLVGAQGTPAVGGLQGIRITGLVNPNDPDVFRIPLSSFSPSHQVRVTCEGTSSAAIELAIIGSGGGSPVATGDCSSAPVQGTVSGSEVYVEVSYTGASEPPYTVVVAAS